MCQWFVFSCGDSQGMLNSSLANNSLPNGTNYHVSSKQISVGGALAKETK